MPTTPSKNKNPNKNQKKKKLTFVTDVSNNKVNNSIDMTNFRNPYFHPLETSKDNKINEVNIELFNTLNKKNLNIKKNPINMRLDEIIDTIKKERIDLLFQKKKKN